jgi:hypothetical protein
MDTTDTHAERNLEHVHRCPRCEHIIKADEIPHSAIAIGVIQLTRDSRRKRQLDSAESWTTCRIGYRVFSWVASNRPIFDSASGLSRSPQRGTGMLLHLDDNRRVGLRQSCHKDIRF